MSDDIIINDSAQFVGELYHISDTQNGARVGIKTGIYGAVFCRTTRDIAKSLRDCFFVDVRVRGRGTWTRTDTGDWEISDFTITDFIPLKRESLRDSVDRIRGLDIYWPTDT